MYSRTRARALWVLFAIVAAVGCGRQVTPNPPGVGAGGNDPGYMSVKFDVNSQFDFSNFEYWIVFNTTGNGSTPLTNPQQNNWQAYSDAIEVGGTGGGTYARAIQFLKNSNPVIPPAFLTLITTPQQLQYIPNSNGSGTEFQVTFQRSIFTPISTPSPGVSPSPLAHTWLFNAFVTQSSANNQLIFVDSMGQGGATDTTFTDQPPLSVCQSFDTVYTKVQDISPPTDPSSQIVSVEIANNGSSPPSCPP